MSDKIWVCDDEPLARFPVHTRGNVGEVFVEAVSPLTWSAYGPNSWDAGWRDAFCEIGLFTPDEFGPPHFDRITDVWSAGRHVVRQGRHSARAAIIKNYKNAVAALLARS